MPTLKANAGKIALIVVLLLAAGTVFLLWGRGHSPRSGKVQMVCVATGKTFWLERAPRIPPVANPETGQKTLLPCYQKADGKLYVDARYRGLIRQLQADGVNQFVDPDTLLVRAEP